VHDLAAQELGQELLPLRALRVVRHFARERVISEQERLREVEERRPQLMLDPRAARRVLDVLHRQALADRRALRSRKNVASSRCGVRRAVGSGDAPSSPSTSAWIVSGSLSERREPALHRLDVGQRLAQILAESEHR
jgi:hypothetical protein